MIIREANVDDISQIQVVRNAVKENPLSNPNLVTDTDCEEFIMVRGKVGYANQAIKSQAFRLLT